MAGSISRRAVLGSGAVLGAAALLTKGQPAKAEPMKPVYPPARVGGTFDLLPFQPNITNYPAAVADWNRTTGTTMKCWKLYYQENSKLPTKLPLDPQMTLMIQQGIQALISFKPTKNIKSPQGRSDRSQLADAVQLLKANRLLAEICLYQEIRPSDMSPGEYKDLVAFYAPVIRPHYPLVFDAPGYQGQQEWKNYKPDDSLLDGYAIDFYGGDFINHNITLDQFFPLAGDKPVGVWEIGNSASAKFTPSTTDVKNYMNHIKDRLTARLMSGLPVGSVAWYNGPAIPRQNGVNEIAGTHPSALAPTDIALYRELYEAVNGKLPTTISA
jgi:hypothetical protein